MTRGRRGVLLVGLALVLGGLAASDVARREEALSQRLAPLVAVVVARTDLAAGERLNVDRLGVRRVPARYAPGGAVGEPAALAGGRLAADVEQGAYVTAGMLARSAAGAGGPPVRRGERALELVATGTPELLAAGVMVDVLVTGEQSTRLALQDVEVLGARTAPEAAVAEGPAGPRVAATLRVTLRQAVYLAAAQAFARDVRLLPRAAGDRRHAGAIEVGESL